MPLHSHPSAFRRRHWRAAAVLIVLAAAALLAPALRAQSTVVSHQDDFQSYGTQKNPPGWVDTSIGSSKPTAGGLYKTWPDPTQGNKGTNVVFGTKQSSGKPEGNNPRIGTFSTYKDKTFSATGRFEYKGRFIRTNADSRVGLTFFSSYPEVDKYYLLGLWSHPSGNLTMQLFGFGGGTPTGTKVSDFTPAPGKWYRFVIQAEDVDNKTVIRARFWLDTNPEPTTWNIDAVDASTTRLKSGRIGIWSAVKGEVYVDDLGVKSPVDHAPPTIEFRADAKPLVDGLKFNHVITPDIIVSDELSGTTWTATLDGAAYTEGTPITGQGDHVLAVEAVDAVGNRVTKSVRFYIDTIPPVVTIVKPANGSITSGDVTVTLHVVDASLPYTTSATLDGAAFDIRNPITAEGSHTLIVTATDAVGLVSQPVTTQFIIDRTAPTYQLFANGQPLGMNEPVFGDNVTITITTNDVTAVTTTLLLDDGAYDAGTLITDERKHTIRGTITDAVGHQTVIATRSFWIDKTAPIVTLLGNEEPLKDLYDVASLVVKIQTDDLTTVHIDATLNNQSFTSPITLTEEKEYILRGTVTDAANHATPFGPRTFFIDRTAPEIILRANGAAFPMLSTGGGHIFLDDVEITLEVRDLTLSETTSALDGAPIASFPLRLTEEFLGHSIKIVATDRLSHTSTVGPIEFTIDKRAPIVTVIQNGTEIPDGEFYNRAITPVIDVVDITTPTIDAKLNGQPFTSGTPVTTDGTYTLTGTVKDAAQRSTPIGPVTFTVDTVAPTGVFREGDDQPFPDGKSVNVAAIRAWVKITDANPLPATVLLDGQPYTERDPITQEDAHTLTATLIDKAGNTGVVPPVTFRIDRTAPDLTLFALGAPMGAPFETHKDVPITFTVTDKSLPVTVTGTIDGVENALPHTVTAEGAHAISGRAVDAAGNVATAGPFTFTIEKTPPTVEVILNGVEAGLENLFNVPVSVTIRVSSGLTSRTKTILIDGSAYVEGALVTGEGQHIVTGTVTTGSELTVPIPETRFTIDVTPPQVTLKNRDDAFEENGFHYNSDVVPNVTCTDNLTQCTVELTVDAAAWNNGAPITSEVPHVVVAGAVDRAGNRTTLPAVDFVIDKTPPALTIVQPTEGHVSSIASVVVTGASDDAVTVLVNGEAATVDTTAKTYATQPIALVEGENELTVTGFDRAGNPAAPKTVRVIVDTRAPGLSNVQPQANACLAADAITVTGNVNDPGIVAVKVSLGDRVVANALDTQKRSFSAPFTAVPEGTHRVVIEATDSLGHRTVNALQVIVDRSAPAIDVLEGGGPLSKNLFNRPLALTFRARDVDPNVVLAVTLAGAPYTPGTPLTAHGAYHFDAVARDCAGNQLALPVDVTLDLVPPVFDTLTPPHGATVGTKPAAITGSVSSDAIEVAIENRAGTVHPDTQGNFTLATELVEGRNELVLRATDAAGNVTRLPYSFTVRSGAPVVRILESGAPLEENALFNRPVRPTVEVSDPTANLVVLINDQTDNGEPLTADGTYTIVATARDDLQRSTTERRTFTIDRTAPVIDITAPQPGVVTSDVVDMAGTAGDAVTVNVHGTTVTPGTNGSFSRAGVKLDLGENELVVSATDRAGNTGYDSVTVTWPGDGPGIVITHPADQSLTNRPRIDVTGRVLDALSGGQVLVGSKSVTLDASGTFRATDYQLVDGPNQLTAAIPNGAQTTITVNADFVPPSLAVLVSGQPLTDNAQFPAAIALAVNAADDRQLAFTRITVDGTEVASLPHNVSATGGHVLSAVARDAAGNETRVERTFFIGANTAAGGCTIEDVDPANNATVAPPSNATVASVRVSGRAPGATSVTVNGVNADVADGTFAATIELPSEGANQVAIRCKDAAGALSEPLNLTYYRVSGMPTVRITDPDEGDVTGDTTITVRGEVGPDVVQADVNGVRATITEGTPRTFVVENITLARGVNVLVAHARNGAYRYGTHSVRVRSEQAQPQIRITSPQANAVAGGLKTTVSGTYTNVVPSTLAIAGGVNAPAVETVVLSDTTGLFVFRNVNVTAGPQTLTVSGRSEMNNNASASVTVNGEAGVPSIDIVAPIDNAWLPAEQPIAVNGTFTGATGTARVDINGAAATVDLGVSTYAGSLEHSPASTFTPISARLLDDTGSGPAVTITVRKLAGPLRILTTFPEDATEGVDPAAIVLIGFSAPLDRTTVNGIRVSKDGATVAGSLRVEDAVVLFTPATLLESGASYRVDVPLTVKDVAGHTLASAASFGFKTLTTAPSLPPTLDPITITGCPSIVDIQGSAPPHARLLLETPNSVPFDGLADANGRFTMRFPLSGRSGYQNGRLYVIASDGSRSPAAPVSFRIDCAGPQVIGASFDRDANVVTIAFSKNIDPATVSVGSDASVVLNVSDGSTPGGTATVTGANVSIVPSVDLRAASFTLEVKTTVKDTTGNALVLPFSQIFSVGGDEEPVPGDGSGFVSGEVYDASTGRPLANVTVASVVPESAFARVPSTSSNTTTSNAMNSARYTIVGTPSRPGNVATTTTQIEVSRTTDERGRYVFSLPEGAHTIEAGAHDYTTVWRQIVVPAGAGVVPIDIRVQRRGEATPATVLPLTLANGGGERSVTRPVTLKVTAGVAPDAKVSVTAVGAQSLAGLLPLGWSPLASAEVAVFGSDNALVAGAPLTADLEFTLPSAEIGTADQKLTFVQYDSDRDEWRTLVPLMAATSGTTWRVAIAGAGAYAVVYRDLATGLQKPPAPVAGATLQPADDTCSPCTLVRKAFNIEPPMVAPSERAVATLEIDGAAANVFPSGTAVQAYVSEVLHLSDGGTVVDPPFTADVLLYRSLDGATGLGEFVIAPSQTARMRVLERGVDQVRILHYPGRLDRGSLIGTEGGRVPGDDKLSLEIPSGATSEGLHATVTSLPQSELGMTIAGFDVVAGFTFTLTRAQEPPPVDRNGDGTPDAPPAVELSRAARATVAVDTATLASPDAQLIVVEVVPDSAWGSFHRLAAPMVRLDAPQPNVTTVRFTTRAVDAELPVDGIVRAGRYLVLAAKAPVAFATGVIASAANTPALVDARIASAMPAGGEYGVIDVTRQNGIFAVPIAANPATNFALTPRHARLGVGRSFSATAPAAGEIVHVADWVFDVQPLHLVRHTPAQGEQVPTAELEVTAEFDLAIDSVSIGNAILVVNNDGNTPLGGVASLDPANAKIIKWRSTGQVAAGATYTAMLQPTIRATNGARYGNGTSFTFKTAPLPRDGEVRPDRMHISMPDEQGIARVHGTAGAIPPTWHINVLRPGTGFRTAYGAEANPDGSFSVLVGGNDPYDRITIEDLIDVQVLNAANNVAMTVRMPAFVTEDGLGFVARAERDSVFVSAEGVKIEVAAGTFEKATLITTTLTNSQETFAGIPNFANELHFYGAVKIDFEGDALKKLEVSIPSAGLPVAGNDFVLGYARETVRGTRVAIASLLRADGDKLTTYFPAQEPQNARARIGRNDLMSFPTASAVMSCMPGVMASGTYGYMVLTPPGGGTFAMWVTVPITQQMDMFNSAFASWTLPNYRHFSRACAAVPVIPGQPFTLVGVDADSGTEIFSKTYDGLLDPGTVTAIDNPNPDRSGPYPLYATPFRIEMIDAPPLADLDGDGVPETGYMITRGLKITLNDAGALAIEKSPAPAPADVLPAKTKISLYNLTQSRHTLPVEVETNGDFFLAQSGVKQGDQLYLYLSAADVSPDTTVAVVMSEPVDVGTIPPGTPDEEQKRLIDLHLRTVMKLEQIVEGGTVDLTSQVTFEALSQMRRIRIDMPAELVRGGRYRLTLLKDMKDGEGNRLAERKLESGALFGDVASDISMDFVARPGPTTETEFDLKPNDTYTGAGLRDMAKYGNLVFVAALEGGLLAYDIAEPSSLSGTPKPIAVVPGNWGGADGAAPMHQFWSVATDHHGRIYGGGFGGGSDGQFGLIRSYRVEDFLDARDNGSNCGSSVGDNLNCRRYGSTIVSWAPGSYMGSQVGVNYSTNQPRAYVRKIKLLVQDETLGAPGATYTFADLDGGGMSGVEVASNTELTSGSEFRRATIRVPFESSVSAAGSQYLRQRVTIINTALDMRWHADSYKGEFADVKNVIARPGDPMVVIRNRTTYAVVTLFGYGAAVYDMNMMETNDATARCGVAAFKLAHPALCSASQGKLSEKIVVTNGDYRTSCPDGPWGGYYDEGETMAYAAEVFGLGGVDATTGVPDLHLFALTGATGLLFDMKAAIPTDSESTTAACATMGFAIYPIAGRPGMNVIEAAVPRTQRLTNGAMYHWRVSKEENIKGLRGSMPNTEVKRDYLLVAANDWGVVIFEVGGTPPDAAPGYFPMLGSNIVDTIWIAAGAQAVSMIDGTDLAAVIDRKGRLLIVDLSNIDERWAPITSTPPAALSANPFKLPTNAMLTPTTVVAEKGVNDPRVIYQSETPFAYGVMPPIVAADSGIAFGGEILGKKMRIRPVLDPKIEFLLDAGVGKGLQSTGKIIPLGVPYPSLKTAVAEGSLSAFRVRVTLPGAMPKALSDQKIHMAIESEVVVGGIAPQTPRSLPRAHLRLNDRQGNEDKRKVQFTLRREIPNITTEEKEFRHQRGYNKLISPWIVAIADPRASERVLASEQTDGCTQCKRPAPLAGLTEAQGVFEMFTNGHFVSARIDSNTADALPVESLPDFYDYLAEKSRFQSRVATVIADTARPKSVLVPGQHPPIAQGTLDGAIYVHSGELQIGASDLTLMGRGPANLALGRSYRSRTIGGNLLGLGWEASFLRRLRELPNGEVEYRDAAGDLWTFKLPKTGTGSAPPELSGLEAAVGTRFRYEAPAGLFLSLMRTEEGWTMLDAKWRVTRFDNFGRIAAESDEFWKPDNFGAGSLGGNQFRYFYNADGRLGQIVDPLSRVTSISYYPPGAPNTDCTNLGAKPSPCAYVGLMKEITDWRGRSVLFEYDRVGRLIGVQLPKTSPVDGAPSAYDFSGDATRPRIRYRYAGGNAFPAEDAPDEEFTNFMQYAANLESVTDPAQESTGTVRAVYTWFNTNDPNTRDKLRSMQWPCASYVGSCSPKQAEVTYAGATTNITDLMDQKWEYSVIDGPDERKHISTVKALDVPTYAPAAGAAAALSVTAGGQTLTTTYSNFDPTGIPRTVTLPGGHTMGYTVTAPTSKAHCRQITQVSESGSGASRSTEIKYDPNPTAPCTVDHLLRDGEKRERQSPHRERKETTVVDQKANVKTTTQYDDYGRPTVLMQEGSTTVYAYNSNLGDRVGWQRLAAVGDSGSTISETYKYFEEGTGQRVVVTDTKRNITTTSRYNADDRVIYRKVEDTGYGTLSEERMAYDADGRLAWTRRTAPSGTFDATTQHDPLGRAISTRTTGNHVNGIAGVQLEVTQTFDLGASNKQVVVKDPAAVGGSPLAEQITTLDNLGRQTRVEHKAIGGGPSVAETFAYDAHSKVSHESDTVRSATVTVRDGIGREIESIGRDDVKHTTSWSTWDQPSEEKVIVSSTLVAHTKQFFTDEGRAYAVNEAIDSRTRQTHFDWLADGLNELHRIGESDGSDALLGGDVRASLTMSDPSGRITEVVTGAGSAGGTGITTPFHRTEYLDFVGNAPRKIVEQEPIRSSSVTTIQQLDGLDRVRTTTVAGEYSNSTDYDVAGNLQSVTPAGLGTTTSHFDSRGLAYRIEKPGAEGVIENKFDATGVLREVRDETGGVTTYETDELGRVVKIGYPDPSPNSYEQFVFEDVTGSLKAQRDRNGQWLSYTYDEGGRVVSIHDGQDPDTDPVIQRMDYDPGKRLERIANKDAAIEYDLYDQLGRAHVTRTVRYKNGTGLATGSAGPEVYDVHSQSHEYSIFNDERTSWHMPVAGYDASASNGGVWRNTITELRDAGSNLVSQTAGTLSNTATAGGIGRITQQKRGVAGGELETNFAFADTSMSGPGPGEPVVGASGRLLQALTKRGSTTVAGTKVYPDRSLRARTAMDLALGRTSKWDYDARGRLENGKLLVPSDEVDTTPGTTEVLTGAEFRRKRDSFTVFGPSEHALLGEALSLELEPLPWEAQEQFGHQIDRRTIFLDSTPRVREYTFDHGRRENDDVWKSTYDAFGRLIVMASASKNRRVEYEYGPNERLVGRRALTYGGTPETRADVLAADGLPAEATFVWDPVSDHLVAIYEAGKSAGGTSSSPVAPDAGLVRQYVHGDSGYDDPVEVLVAKTPGSPVNRYLPVFDDAATSSLQAVVDEKGDLVERVLYGDSYGDAPRYLHGAVVEKVSFSAERDPLGNLKEVIVRARVSENITGSSVAGGFRLAAIDDAQQAVNVHSAAPELVDIDDLHEVRWKFSAIEWTAFMGDPRVSSIEVAVTSSLRTDAWGTNPVQKAPEWAMKIYSVTTDSTRPVIVRTSLTTLNTAPASGEPIALYEIDNLYLAATPDTRTHLLTGFKAAPFIEPANGHAYFRARWYDPATGTFLTPDPLGYVDSSNLYAFAGADPVNGSDPTGTRTATIEDTAVRMMLLSRVLDLDQGWENNRAGRFRYYRKIAIQRDFFDTEGVPGEYNYVMKNAVADTEAEYRSARAYLLDDLQTFDKAVARADDDGSVYYIPLQGFMTRTREDERYARNSTYALTGIMFVTNYLPQFALPARQPMVQFNGGGQPIPWQVNGPVQVTRAFPRGVGIMNPGRKLTTHNLNIRVQEPDGHVIGPWREISGVYSRQQEAMPFPANSLSSHTEPKGLSRLNLGPGYKVTMTGQLTPCPGSCNPLLRNTAMESGSTIIYRWREGGRTRSNTYLPSGQVIQK